MDEQGLGRRLQVARQAAGLTQQELCQKASIAYSTLAKIERGAIKSPSIFTIAQISKVIGVSLDTLLGITPGQTEAAAPAKQYGRSKLGVTFIYFDINGCLVHFFNRAFTKLAADHGASPDVMEKTFWHYNDAVCRGEISLDEFNRIIADKLGAEHLNWMDYYLSAVEPVEEMRDLLTWTAEHYRIGLLSNIMPGFIDEMIKRNIIPKLDYAAIVDSSKVGAIKPEPKMYEIAQGMAGVPPEEILFVDDSRSNLMAAERFGWHVLWFDDFQPSEAVARVRGALELAVDSPAPQSGQTERHEPHDNPAPTAQPTHHDQPAHHETRHDQARQEQPSRHELPHQIEQARSSDYQEHVHDETAEPQPTY
jgi:FMN phosphatase YigB (HAD superfamily)/transcriptional regulator with XRE-family HTH domain